MFGNNTNLGLSVQNDPGVYIKTFISDYFN